MKTRIGTHSTELAQQLPKSSTYANYTLSERDAPPEEFKLHDVAINAPAGSMNAAFFRIGQGLRVAYDWVINSKGVTSTINFLNKAAGYLPGFNIPTVEAASQEPELESQKIDGVEYLALQGNNPKKVQKHIRDFHKKYIEIRNRLEEEFPELIETRFTHIFLYDNEEKTANTPMYIDGNGFLFVRCETPIERIVRHETFHRLAAKQGYDLEAVNKMSRLLKDQIDKRFEKINKVLLNESKLSDADDKIIPFNFRDIEIIIPYNQDPDKEKKSKIKEYKKLFQNIFHFNFVTETEETGKYSPKILRLKELSINKEGIRVDPNLEKFIAETLYMHEIMLRIMEIPLSPRNRNNITYAASEIRAELLSRLDRDFLEKLNGTAFSEMMSNPNGKGSSGTSEGEGCARAKLYSQDHCGAPKWSPSSASAKRVDHRPAAQRAEL